MNTGTNTEMSREEVLKRVRLAKERKAERIEQLKEKLRQRHLARTGKEPESYWVL